jgi:hypothetical protein
VAEAHVASLLRYQQTSGKSYADVTIPAPKDLMTCLGRLDWIELRIQLSVSEREKWSRGRILATEGSVITPDTHPRLNSTKPAVQCTPPAPSSLSDSRNSEPNQETCYTVVPPRNSRVDRSTQQITQRNTERRADRAKIARKRKQEDYPSVGQREPTRKVGGDQQRHGRPKKTRSCAIGRVL